MIVMRSAAVTKSNLRGLAAAGRSYSTPSDSDKGEVPVESAPPPASVSESHPLPPSNLTDLPSSPPPTALTSALSGLGSPTNSLLRRRRSPSAQTKSLLTANTSNTTTSTTSPSSSSLRGTQNVNNRFLLYGKKEFGALPNILHNERLLEQYQIGLRLVPAERNSANLLDRKVFPYGFEEATIREWQQMAEMALTVGTERFDLLHGVRDRSKRTLSSLVSPCLLLSYSGNHGEVMLEEMAKGLAASLKADFVALDVRDYLAVGRYLLRMCLTNCDMESLDGKTLSSFLKKSMRTGTAQYPELNELLSMAPSTAALEFLEYCLMTMDGVDEDCCDPSERRVIYLYNGRGHDSFSFADAAFRSALMKLMASRETFAPKTLFILSEGCNYAPPSRQEESALSVSVSGLSEWSLDGLDEKTASSKSSLSAFKPTSALIPATPLASSAKDNTSSPYSWIIDPQLKALRIFAVPPHDRTLASQHRRQLERDHRWVNFDENISQLYGILSEMANQHPNYAVFLTGIGLTDHRLFTRDQLQAHRLQIRDTLGPHLQSAFQDAVWSHAEHVALCLSLPRDELLCEDPVELLVRTVRIFCLNRLQQGSTLHHLNREADGDGETSSSHPHARRLPFKVDTLNKYEKRFVGNIVTPEMVTTRYADIGSLEKVKETLYELISLRLERPELFSKGILKESVSGILLFGPPGTGKTMLAKAVAAQSGANFITVNSSSIFDMFVGEGEKNVKALFSLARKLSPCVVFVDEVDALLETRSNPISRASRLEIINEFMSEWDGVLSNNQGVTIMAATNRPFALDDAVLRRLPRRVLVDLPDVSGRLSILRLLLKDDPLCGTVDLEHLARQTEFYSGSDLKNLCMAAAFRALRRVRHGAPPSAIDSQMVITKDDLISALSDVPASLSDKMNTLNDLREWDNMYGEGARKARSKPSLGFQPLKQH